ncbi:hypothetical protein evm_011156 [Chilo suppressalis]|nr:hypothetical protein evm_011156 [Chilo suppressalis]
MRTPSCAGGAVAVVPRWSQAAPAHCAPHAPDHDHDQLAYPHDPEINNRFAIWQGDITTLDVDAITNSSDETLLECNPLSERIMAAAGGELKEEMLSRGLDCSAGGAGAGGRGRVLVHTARVSTRVPAPQHCYRCSAGGAGAGGRGRVLVHTARVSTRVPAPQHCYRNVLRRATELGVRSIALSVINSTDNAFPPATAAHAALRTIRKHLEQHRLPQLVVLTCASQSERALYAAIAPLYFPYAPRDVERRVRIIHNPHSHAHAEDDASLCDEDAAAEAAAAFARACAPDTQRLLAPAPRTPALERRLRDDRDQYERLLRRARTEDLSEVSGIGCLYQSGVDRLGRPVVIFIGKWFPIGDVDLDKALLYLILLLDPIVRGDYVIAYFHTLASAANHPPFSWLKEVYTVLPYKYKKNLKAFYIVHPTFWTKMMTWWFTTFMAPAIKAKVHSLPGVEYLYSVMPRDQLELPAFVTEYDMTINGLHYFQPDTNNT